MAALALVTGAQVAATPEELDACGEAAGAVCLWVFRTTDNKLLATLADVLLVKLVLVLVILAGAFVLTRLVRKGIRRFVVSIQDAPGRGRFATLRERTPAALLATGPVNLRAAQRAETIGAVLRSVATFVIWSMAILMVLNQLTIQIGPLIAGAGIAGIALGFGAQSLVKDFLSGMFMLLEDQFGVGDIVDVGEASGTVEGLSLRTTRLRDVEGTVWHVPNGEIRRVGNKSQEWSRALLDVEVAYDTDLAKAQDIIKRTADAVWADEEFATSILEEPQVWGVEALGASGIAIRLVLKTKPADQWKVMRELRRQIKDAFDAEGVEIPFPQQAIWVRRREQTAEAGDEPGPPGAPEDELFGDA